MSTRLLLTPWSRDAMEAAHVNRFELLGRVPVGWTFMGSAKSNAGPFTFIVRRDADGQAHTVSAHRISDIPDAIERALVLIAEDSLEGLLAASLEARR